MGLLAGVDFCVERKLPGREDIFIPYKRTIIKKLYTCNALDLQTAGYLTSTL
jgi:hypothetical protein